MGSHKHFGRFKDRVFTNRTLSKAEVTKRLLSLETFEPIGLYEHFDLAQCPVCGFPVCGFPVHL